MSLTTRLIKVFHASKTGRHAIAEWLEDCHKTLHGCFTLALTYHRWELAYSVSMDEEDFPAWESRFYAAFPDHQLAADDRKIGIFDPSKTAVAEIALHNSWCFPFKIADDDTTDYITSVFRTLEAFDVGSDRASLLFSITHVEGRSLGHAISSRWTYRVLKWKLMFSWLTHLFDTKMDHGWKMKGQKFFEHKLKEDLFDVRISFVVESATKRMAGARVASFLRTLSMFENYPINEFHAHESHEPFSLETVQKHGQKLLMTPHEIAALFHFPSEPMRETALLKSTARRLALPIGTPITDYELVGKEVVAVDTPPDLAIVGISDYRSTRVPIGIYDEDRLRHVYVIGKTGVGKSKFLMSTIIDDIVKGKGVGLIDPHGDLIEEALAHVPPERVKDIVFFDPTDSDFPFRFNPLSVRAGESKQILAKGFIDIFKKFFGANWNPKLEHVLRMVFLGLLDKKDSTLFDIIRALTNKDFRYEMIEAVEDDVVKNFWTNEFAGWSQQFNSEAIMPILNKVGQLLSINLLKNIFASPENRLDFMDIMDSGKIFLIKLPKGALQEEIMGFLGAMMITKLYQTAMARQGRPKDDRRPFFLYVDEFQNFATETFNEILSEARKYGLSMTVAHQFLEQIPPGISKALFGNVGTLVSFRVSSDDALEMKRHFDPFLDAYDLANLSQRECYAKMVVKGQVKDPFSLRTAYIPDVKADPQLLQSIVDSSRSLYCRPLQEARKTLVQQQADVVKTMAEFGSPLL